MGGREDRNVFPVADYLAGQGVNFANPVDLVTEELNPDRLFLPGGWEDFHHVAPDPEAPALEINVVTVKLDLN